MPCIRPYFYIIKESQTYGEFVSPNKQIVHQIPFSKLPPALRLTRNLNENNSKNNNDNNSNNNDNNENNNNLSHSLKKNKSLLRAPGTSMRGMRRKITIP